MFYEEGQDAVSTRLSHEFMYLINNVGYLIYAKILAINASIIQNKQ